jgi:hypothetical protein
MSIHQLSLYQTCPGSEGIVAYQETRHLVASHDLDD